MKLTFEGTYYEDILTQMANVLAATARQSKNISAGVSENESTTALPLTRPVAEPQGPGPETIASPPEPFASPVETPADNPVEKPAKKTGKVRSAKQLENDERLRKLAVEKAAAKKAPAEAPAEEPAPKAAAAPVAPSDMVKIRIRTIAELQEAYANGQQKEVFELLSKYGKGAKSFRELPPEAFAPIREAIDAGALT